MASGAKLKFGIEKKKKPDVEFVTSNGTAVKLIYNKEYRAFKSSCGSWIPMNLGGSDPASLREYIDKHF